MKAIDTTKRLEALRQLMRDRQIDAYKFISGFTGSAGTAVVTQDKAALETDGRYFNQAEQELDSNWLLLKRGLKDVPSWDDWTADEARDGRIVGIDPTLITADGARKLQDKVRTNGGFLHRVPENLVDLVWGNDRPARPQEKVKVHPIEFAGKSFEEKVADLREKLKNMNRAGFVISMLDEIAWLFNLRGNDIAYNPVFFAYAAVTPTTVDLYIDEEKLTPEVREYLGDKVNIKPYDSFFSGIRALGETLHVTGDEDDAEKFLVSKQASWALYVALGGQVRVAEARSPIADAKAVKNEIELSGMRDCHVRDGAALNEYFAWLEQQLTSGVVLDEVQAADKLEECRAKQKHFVGLSFPTISSTGANGAIIHYEPERGSCSVIDPKAVYLCDSGAQYLDGTTDVTRTWHFGTPTEKEKFAFTMVLKGVIGLDTAVFPKGTTGYALDVLARQSLWKNGLDYMHGTGHGVGSYLNVHEGPMGVGYRLEYAQVSLAAGNVISDEPGYYEDGNFGIRIENIIMCRPVKTKYSFGDRPYLGFEHVTMTPICKNLIEPSLLSGEEKQWLNDYHKEIYEKTSPYFENDEFTLNWLKRETSPLA
ncbi:hypothetical protein KEM56_007514 [Ascosphaera pollenicola]|nr:hypothetical protein KEM56_007514 [Ascosphaera pollenicola]